MAKGDKFYFDNFVASTAFSQKAAAYLVECLENFDPANMEEMMTKMHEIEHSADLKKHEMNEALAKAFVTPVDREDLDMLSRNLDTVTDCLEEVLQKFYIYNVQCVEPDMIEYAKVLVRACDLMGELMGEFENFKRSKKIHGLIIAINDAEEECDKLYLNAMRSLTQQGNVLDILIGREIYECLEACADACEEVSECVDSVIMKNT